MKSKKMIWTTGLIIFSVVFITCAYAFAKNYSTSGRQVGQIVKKYKVENSQKNDSVLARAGDIEILSDDVEYYKELRALSGESIDEKAIVRDLVIEQLLLKEAERLGITVTDEEVDQINGELRKNAPRDPQGYSQFKEMIASIGWTEDEYWEKSKPVYKKAYTIGKLKNEHLKPLFKEQNKELPASVMDSKFEEYFETYKEKLLESCPIEYLK